MTMQLHRPDGEGGLEARPDAPQDWRTQLESPRWGTSLKGDALPKLVTLSVAPLIGEAIKRIHRGESVGALFSSEVSFTQEMLLWDDNGPGDAPAGDDDVPSAVPAPAGA